MNEIKVIANAEFGNIRMLEENGKALFCGVDVAKALGYSNTRDALSRHCKEKGVAKHDTLTNGGIQALTYIDEGNIYRLIAHSKLPNAELFETWVFDEVLPTIRKHGAYMTPETIEKTLSNPDFIIQLATTLKTEQEKNKKLQISVSQLTVDKQIMQPKADYFDELVDRNLLTGIRETAKELKVKQKVFVNFLLDKKYLYRDKKGKLMPHAKPLENGLFELKEFANEKTGFSSTQAFVTPKGKETFRLLLLN